MIYDTNLLIKYIRSNISLPAVLIIPIVIVGELEAFALKADWGYQKIFRLQQILDAYPIVAIDREPTRVYAPNMARKLLPCLLNYPSQFFLDSWFLLKFLTKVDLNFLFDQ